MARMLDLPSELLQLIMILLAKSWKGAEDFARATSVCRVFLEFADNAEVLKALCFDNMSISNRYGLFQRSNSLLFKCAQHKNPSSQHLLSKILLMSTSLMYSRKLKDSMQSWSNIARPTYREIMDQDILDTNFLARVLQDPTCSRHSKLVLNFLRNCSPKEILEMGEFVIDYVRCFGLLEPLFHDRLDECIRGMMAFAKDVIAAVEVDLTVIEGILDEKYMALENMWDLKVTTSGESSSDMQIIDQIVEKEALLSEIEELQSRVSTIYEFGNINEHGITHDKDPATYFEECRRDALLFFGHIFPESV